MLSTQLNKLNLISNDILKVLYPYLDALNYSFLED